MNLVLIEAIPLLLQAVCRVIESKLGNKVCYYAPNIHNLESVISEFQPDLLWLDTTIPEVHDGSAFQSIHKNYPHLKILLFGVGETVPEIRKYFKQGICAYLPKSADAAEIESALACVESGELYVPASLNKAMASWLTDPVGKKKPGCKLTQREQEILQLIVEEFTTSEIAKKLYICKCTVETHRINLIEKLGVKNVAGLVREAIQRQLYLC
jgi:DNA-binding NarL/FixJ family response regulator